MKIAIVGTRGIPAEYGGFETFAEELAHRLVNKDIEVSVYCEKRGPNELGTYKGVTLEYIHAMQAGPLTTILFDLQCIWSAKKKYDVVYMLGYGTALFCLIPRMWGTTVWLNMDGIEWARSKWNWLAKFWFRLMEAVAMWTPDHLIADAHAILQHLQLRHRHIPSCSVIPYGAAIIDNPQPLILLDDLKLIPGNYYLLVCRLEPENHVHDIIQGFCASGSPRQLVVIGNYATSTAYVQRLMTVTDKRIRFIGTIYNKHKLQAIRFYARGYFHGHSVGGTNPSLLEALGCGNVIIAHDNVFNREVAGDIGFYFQSSADILSIIHRVDAMDEDTRHLRALLARKRIMDNYAWDSITDKYIELLQSFQSRE